MNRWSSARDRRGEFLVLSWNDLDVYATRIHIVLIYLFLFLLFINYLMIWFVLRMKFMLYANTWAGLKSYVWYLLTLTWLFLVFIFVIFYLFFWLTGLTILELLSASLSYHLSILIRTAWSEWRTEEHNCFEEYLSMRLLDSLQQNLLNSNISFSWYI